MLPIGLCAQLACVWETTACNPGNAHRFHDFHDVSYVDFLASAAAIAPILEGATRRPVGETVLLGVEATQTVVRHNTNLGILLLLAPLAAVPRDRSLREGSTRVLESLTVTDAALVYRAIRLAAPAGLGTVPEQDVRDEPTMGLRQVMKLSADLDAIARQYANGFQEVFDVGLPLLCHGLAGAPSLEAALVYCHIALLAQLPDSLIVRKRGPAEAQEASQRARALLAQVRADLTFPAQELQALDAWLCEAGRGRNPGTTSDLITACLFTALRDGIMELPLKLPWSNHG
jgi:triphosphoribosyl-dephospho-CoA synthase